MHQSSIFDFAGRAGEIKHRGSGAEVGLG